MIYRIRKRLISHLSIWCGKGIGHVQAHVPGASFVSIDSQVTSRTIRYHRHATIVSMSDTNDITIESYNAHIQEYIDGTTKEISAVVRNWLDKSLFGLSKKARILELGSAFGRDASYITELGYTVECSDATSAFVDLLNASGFNARILNVITDNLPLGLDLVVAHAVLLHFTRTETHQVIKKVFNALNANGTFAFTLKKPSLK